MATNCPQQVKPRAWRSAWCLRTAVSNSQRENSPRICEKMLQNRFTAEPPKSLIGSARTQSQLSRGSAFFAPDFAIHNLDKPDWHHEVVFGNPSIHGMILDIPK